MRPQCCAQGHELVWLTNHLAVCNECDEEEFIYHHPGLLKQLVRCCHYKFVTVREPTDEPALRPLHVFSVAGLRMLLH